MSQTVYTLTNVLQQLLLPPDTPIDPNEKSEIIKTDFATVTIEESITLHSSPSHSDTATVTISETIAKDPLGAGVSPLWRVGPYIPTSISDTKRVINLDRTPADLY